MLMWNSLACCVGFFTVDIITSSALKSHWIFVLMEEMYEFRLGNEGEQMLSMLKLRNLV